MSTELALPQESGTLIDVEATAKMFGLAHKMAQMFAESSIVPVAYQKNVANCFIAVNMALRMKADPMMVMQNLYPVYGNPAWSSKFLIATFNSCGRFSSIRYVWEGEKGTDSFGCHAEATELSTGNVLRGSTVTLEIAKREGWGLDAKSRNGKSFGGKWLTMPEQMLMYRAAAWFIRVYAPEISMGLQTKEEIDDVHELQQDSTGTYSIASADDKSEKPTLRSLVPKAKIDYEDEITQADDVDKLRMIYAAMTQDPDVTEERREELKAKCTQRKEEINGGKK